MGDHIVDHSPGGRLSDEGLAQFAVVADRHVSPDTVPGLVALAARGDQVQVEVRGTLAVGGAPVRRDSLFRIASNTKPVTAVAILSLVDEGLIGLDDPVDRWLPELAHPRVLRRPDGPLSDTVPARRAITVRDLLTFTHGFGISAEMMAAPEPWPIAAAEAERSLFTFGPPNPAAQPDPDTWIERLGSLPLVFQPGERWLYNTGASVLGVLAARVTGRPFAEVLRHRIFEPLGMDDTSMGGADTARLATSYRGGPDGLAVWDEPDGMWSRPPVFPDGAAGLVSAVDDLLALARMLLRGGAPVLSATSVVAMTRNHLTEEQRAGTELFLSGQGWGFCQAVRIDGPRAGSYGWSGGFGTTWTVDPVRDLVVIVLTQKMFDSPQLPPVHAELQEAAYAALA